MIRILLLDTLSDATTAPETSAFSQGTQLAARLVSGPWSASGLLYDNLLEDIAVFDAGLNAQQEGFNAVCVHSLSEGGANALRSTLDIPVLHTARTAFLQAMTLGARIGVMANTPNHALQLSGLLRQWQLEHACAGGVQVLESGNASAGDLIRKCIEQHGADVICSFLNLDPASLAKQADELGCPLINPLMVTCQLAESFVATELTHGPSAVPRPIVPKIPVVQGMARAMNPLKSSPFRKEAL